MLFKHKSLDQNKNAIFLLLESLHVSLIHILTFLEFSCGHFITKADMAVRKCVVKFI